MPKFTAAERDAILTRWSRAFGKALAHFREDLGLTQQDLADRMGWRSRTTVAKLESGARPPASCEARLLAHVLSIKHDDLIKTTETWFVALADPSEAVALGLSPSAGR